MKKYFNLIYFIVIIILVFIFIYVLNEKYQFFSIQSLKKFAGDGFLPVIILIVLQAIQVVCFPINSLILTIPIIILMGPMKAFVISSIGTIIGSIIVFYLARVFGSKFLSKLVGDEDIRKWQKNISASKYTLPIFYLIPIFPDDVISMAAGLSNISKKYFIFVISITRTIDAFFTCFVGSSIPFEGIYLLFWGIVLIIVLILTFYLNKNSEKIERFIQNKIIKKP